MWLHFVISFCCLGERAVCADFVHRISDKEITCGCCHRAGYNR